MGAVIISDGIHVSAAANRLMAKRLVPAIHAMGAGGI